MRHVVAWLAPVRSVSCLVLWAVVAVVWALPHLELPLRAVAPLGLAAAMCRTGVAWWTHGGRTVPRPALALALSADALLLTGLLDITGGPFNPFIVMYVTYVWTAAVTLSPRWGVLVAVVRAAGFGWLMPEHVQADLAEHHRLNDFPTHLFTM
jgi:two-component system sensor histidine kinase RegB